MNRSLFKFALSVMVILPLSFTHAGEKCDLDYTSRARLSFADNSTVTGIANKVFASADSQSELKLFLTFELSKKNVWGDTIWSCNEPEGDDLERFLAISAGLEQSPTELRAVVQQLMRRYPRQLVKDSYYVRYSSIADVLEGYISSERGDLNAYLKDVEAYRDEFLGIMQANHVQWSVGIMPSGFNINSPDNEGAIEKAQNEVWEKAYGNPTMVKLVASGVQPTIINVVDEKSITLINDTIDDYAALFSLGLTPEAAVVAVTDELRRSGHGYLKAATRNIRRGQQ
ncbi:MAG: hypothetical protein KDD35_12355 [Bdellovibrionales bacterium]|nr:hypothetical protein [Bdellovibrionales bacterium]